ncbi:unnamed protein product [Somion occarium]|uniref:Uncharacterized protein n=1 Tax=Somion occarium TaxID=3059160 RepID=A0ABP1CYZ0_9APHY
MIFTNHMRVFISRETSGTCELALFLIFTLTPPRVLVMSIAQARSVVIFSSRLLIRCMPALSCPMEARIPTIAMDLQAFFAGFFIL